MVAVGSLQTAGSRGSIPGHKHCDCSKEFTAVLESVLILSAGGCIFEDIYIIYLL